MKKTLTILALSATTTFALFALMAALVSNDQVAPPVVKPPVIVDVMQRQEETIIEDIVRLKPVPPVPEQPQIREIETADPVVPTIGVYNPPTLGVKSSNDGFDTLIKKQDQEARPIVRINPKYPVDAARKGLEGWVILAFDINAIGEVININVLDSEPKRIFDKAAKRALSKWKYQAKSVAGKAIIQTDFTVQLDFKMDQSS